MLTETSIVTPCRDTERINSVINDPSVRPFVGAGPDVLDASAIVADPNNIFFMGEHGGIGLTFSAPRIYEVHTFILKTGRGAWARSCAASVIRQARHLGIAHLWTRIAPEMTNVIAFAQEMGMVPTGDTVMTFGAPYPSYEMAI